MAKYKFYYDESEHSRKINRKTITADNYSDNFVATIVGWESKDEADLENRYTAFEEKYKNRQSKGELKSNTIKQGQFKNGFASLNKDNLSLLEDFFDLFDERIFIYYVVASKVEHIILQLFEDYENSLFVDMDSMKYSITKAIIVYQPQDIIAGLYDNTGELIVLLEKFFAERIESNKTNALLKQQETEQFKQILMLLNDVSKIRTLDWNYNIVFMGFKKYLSEKAMQNHSLVIDREGENSNTASAAKLEGIHCVEEGNSTDFFGVRMADMLAGVVSKLLKALYNANRYASSEEYISKKLLGKDWFILNERQLSLYKKMYFVAIDLHKAYYKAFAGLYSDNLVTLIALLGFMNHFDSVEDIKDIDMQCEYFNAYACERLSKRFEQMQNKLLLDHVADYSKDYLLNRRGTKICFNVEKQPIFVIEGSQRTCDVLSVGFNKDMIPLMTIVEDNEIMCYRLPVELKEWVMTLVGLASMAENIFPSKILFSKANNKYFAEIL